MVIRQVSIETAGLFFFLEPDSKDLDPWNFPATEHHMKCSSIRISVFKTVRALSRQIAKNWNGSSFTLISDTRENASKSLSLWM